MNSERVVVSAICGCVIIMISVYIVDVFADYIICEYVVSVISGCGA